MTDETYEQPARGWTCFHCGETFTTWGSARDHFGATQGAEPGCLIADVPIEEGGKPEVGRGLLMALRKAEATIVQLRHDIDKLENDARLYHELRAEMQRLIGDRSLFMELDYRNGEKIVLEERIKALEAELTQRNA